VNEEGATPPPKVATSSTELLTRLQRLIERPNKPTAALLAKTLVASEVVPWRREDVAAVATALARVDSDWSLRLAVLMRGLPNRKSEFSLSLHQLIVQEARAASIYPGRPVESREAGRIYREWSSGATRGSAAGLSTPLVLVSMWPDRNASWFAQIALDMLGATSRLGKSDPAQAAADIAIRALGDSKNRRLAEGIAALLAAGLAARDRALLEGRLSAEETERARRARVHAEDVLSEREAALRSAMNDLDVARSKVALLEAELDTTRQAAAEDVLGVRTASTNEVARLRAKVLGVLRHEGEQLRLYLDRAQPNVGQAVARLRFLDELRSDLEREEAR
jgi:hypothetical protein